MGMRDKMTTNMWEKHAWMKLGSVKDTGDTGTYFQRINAGRKEQEHDKDDNHASRF
jgi:hypothetical protein